MNVSIIIPCFNQGDTLEEALNSALASEGAPEVIVVNDASTDEATCSMIQDLKKRYPAVQFIDHPENRGLAAARNTGIRAARGEAILPLDSDDRVRPTFAAHASEVLQREPGVGVVYGAIQLFGAIDQHWAPRPADPVSLLHSNPVPSCAVFRRKVWEQVNGYEETRFRAGWEDWDFWLSALAQGWAFHALDEVTFDYRKKDQSMSTEALKPDVRKALFAALFERHRDLYRDHFDALYLRKEEELADLNWRLTESAGVYIKDLERELGEALQLQNEIRWFLNARARVKGWLSRRGGSTP